MIGVQPAGVPVSTTSKAAWPDGEVLTRGRTGVTTSFSKLIANEVLASSVSAWFSVPLAEPSSKSWTVSRPPVPPLVSAQVQLAGCEVDRVHGARTPWSGPAVTSALSAGADDAP